ncbi:MAG: HAMP domain-containing sensor histidine kinase [Eubacteriales bacterium]|nr:HAMP domain-containing sensor histidine kinase [Eubacteriales bacterium]
MKKKYLSFGIIYFLVVLLIFLAGISFYSKKKIDELNAGMCSVLLYPDSIMRDYTTDDPEITVCNVLGTWEFMSYLNKDVGFYSSVVDTGNNGSVVFESRDFYIVHYYGESETEVIENSSERYETKSTQLVPGDSRYMIFEEPLSLSKDEITALRFPNGSSVSITGASCDKRFVYGGTLTYTYEDNTRTVNIATPGFVNEDESVPYEEWIVRLDGIECYSFGGNTGINNKAHKLSDAYVDKFMKGKVPAGLNVEEGIFTTTASAIYVSDKGNYLATYYCLLHPFQLVLRDHLIVYILSVLALVLVEAVIISAVRKLYLNQKRFELRSEKLTKGIAYDLQGPLAATRGYLDNWEDLSKDKRAEYSEKIISEVDHMSSMVTRLLELSKIHDGSVKLNLEDVDLLKLTQNIKKRNSKAILEKNIDLTIECDKEADAYPVYADLEMMYIVINNFITNAIKYCDHTIKIRLKNYRNSIEFSITNDGAGIEKADLDKVWDVLYKADKGSSETGENSGVGLSVVKSILDAHNAKCGCFSGFKGTNFWFLMDRYEETK